MALQDGLLRTVLRNSSILLYGMGMVAVEGLGGLDGPVVFVFDVG